MKNKNSSQSLKCWVGKKMLLFALLYFALILSSLKVEAQTSQNIVIPSGSFIINMGVSPITYVYSDRACLITNFAHKTGPLGGITLVHYNHKS